MRDYSKISSAFWTGNTGKALRGDADAQIVALYLMTTHHANMIGVFHCPLLYVSHETGRTIKGASKGLARCIEAQFCTFDEASEMVWVHEMARFQVGESLSRGDKRVKSIQKAYENIAQHALRAGFFGRYKDAFHLVDVDGLVEGHGRGIEAPSKPVTVAVAVTVAEEDPSHEEGLSKLVHTPVRVIGGGRS